MSRFHKRLLWICGVGTVFIGANIALILLLAQTSLTEERVDGRAVSEWQNDLESPNAATSKTAEMVFLKRLSHPSEHERAYAAGEIWRSFYLDGEVIDALIGLMGDSSLEVRKVAKESLLKIVMLRQTARIRSDLVRALVARLSFDGENPKNTTVISLFTNMIKLDDLVLPELRQQLVAESSPDRQRSLLLAIRLLGNIARPLLADVERYVDSPDRAIAEEARAAIVSLQGSRKKEVD